MKAPDKIYVDKFGQSIEGYIPEGCSLVTEYIRKDALLEWAKNMRLICKDAKPIEKAYQTMIDKIESL